ncbi:hypothetical protein KP509_34G057200 [Ceratopteris richardii]|uniref:GDP-mannose 4,6-dehydratase n=1 Tax=Ceratopteris richardii TaxID=49495 RepID=A0A8T2QLX4_CERRI|nr:hypothetical protein KP509_34G057200 [Ceratopteris richardii]
MGECLQKKALITGITGQNGSYLTEPLLNKGYEVHGINRRSSNLNTERRRHIYIDPETSGARIKLQYGDLTDASSLRNWIDKICLDEVYHLDAQSHVGVLFKNLEYPADVVATGSLRLLQAVQSHIEALNRKDENAKFHPRSPYGVAKVAAYWYTVHYRETYGLFACNGILFNHESARRAENFVTRKITGAVGQCGDYVVATEEFHIVEELLEVAFGHVELNWKNHLQIDENYCRPLEELADSDLEKGKREKVHLEQTSPRWCIVM